MKNIYRGQWINNDRLIMHTIEASNADKAWRLLVQWAERRGINNPTHCHIHSKTKNHCTKTISRIALILFCVWTVFSYAEILCRNTRSNPQYSAVNYIAQIIQRGEK